MPVVTVAAVVLAAGGGERFVGSGGGGPKQLVAVAGEPMVATVVRAAREAGFDEVILVSGAVDLSGFAAGVTLVDNPRWGEGLATSLQTAIDLARSRGHEAVVVGLADQPGVPAAAWSAVAAAPEVPPIAVATYGGRRGNPVRLHDAVWELLPTAGDEGARSVMRARPDLVREVPCPGDPRDIDTMQDLEAWS